MRRAVALAGGQEAGGEKREVSEESGCVDAEVIEGVVHAVLNGSLRLSDRHILRSLDQ